MHTNKFTTRHFLSISCLAMFRIFLKSLIECLSGLMIQNTGFNLNYAPDFSCYKVLVSNCWVLSKSPFIDDIYTKITKYSINEAADVPLEYVIFVYFFFK